MPAVVAYDGGSKQFTLAHEPLVLTPREHAVLRVLIQRSGQPMSKLEIVERVFSDEQDVQVEVVEVLVHRLRKRLADRGVSIATLRGLGYVLVSRALKGWPGMARWSLDAWHRLSLRRSLLLILLPGLLVVVGAEMLVTWRNALDATNAAYDRSLFGAVKSIDANISTESGGLGVELPYRLLEFFQLTASGQVFYRVATEDGLADIGYADLPRPRSALTERPAAVPRCPLPRRASARGLLRT